MAKNTHPPEAKLINRDDLPFIELDNSADFIDSGSMKLQLLQANIEVGTYVVRTLFAPGTVVQRHLHTGEIYAFTSSGSWYYKEYPDDINLPGAYLYEPAGSEHTLHVPASNSEDTEVCFVMNGANLNLDDDGNITSILDASVMTNVYLTICEKMGFDIKDKVIGL